MSSFAEEQSAVQFDKSTLHLLGCIFDGDNLSAILLSVCVLHRRTTGGADSALLQFVSPVTVLPKLAMLQLAYCDPKSMAMCFAVKPTSPVKHVMLSTSNQH